MSENTRPRLLVLTSAFPRIQGEQRDMFMLELCKRLTEHYEVYVLVPHDKGFPKREEYDGMHIFKHPQTPFNTLRIAYGSGILPNIRRNPLLLLAVPFFFLYQLYYTRRLIRREKIGVINANWVIPQGLTAALYKRFFNRKIKLVITIHGTDLLGLSGTFLKRLQRFVLNQSDRIITVSNALKANVSEAGFGRKTFVRSMGIDTRQFSPEFQNRSLRQQYDIHGPLLLFVGALIPRKDPETLIRALPAVIREYPDVKLLMIGEGQLEEDLKRWVRELNISSSVIFTGALPYNALPAYFATADVFVLPTRMEGLGLVVAEAMASGTVTIASDLPVIHDLITHGENGFLVPPGNSELLADQMIFVLRNLLNFEDLRRSAREHVCRHFDWNIVASEYSSYISKL